MIIKLYPGDELIIRALERPEGEPIEPAPIEPTSDAPPIEPAPPPADAAAWGAKKRRARPIWRPGMSSAELARRADISQPYAWILVGEFERERDTP